MEELNPNNTDIHFQSPAQYKVNRSTTERLIIEQLLT